MFRTKDLVLFFSIVLFLVMAIGVTVVRQSGGDTQYAVVPNTTPEISGVSANIEVTKDITISREQRLEQLKEKIKNSELVTISQPVVDDTAVTSSSVSTTPEILASPLLCTNYNDRFEVVWPTVGVKMEFVEGARQYFVESSLSAGTSSSSTVLQKDVLLVLPTQFLPFGQQTCLASDIIGISLDGSLIRNSETALYGLFGSQTLVGYALDGFPIYGVGTNETDKCGGRIEQGQYRYELSDNRSNIINCFAVTPQSLGT